MGFRWTHWEKASNTIGHVAPLENLLNDLTVKSCLFTGDGIQLLGCRSFLFESSSLSGRGKGPPRQCPEASGVRRRRNAAENNSRRAEWLWRRESVRTSRQLLGSDLYCRLLRQLLPATSHAWQTGTNIIKLFAPIDDWLCVTRQVFLFFEAFKRCKIDLHKLPKSAYLICCIKKLLQYTYRRSRLKQCELIRRFFKILWVKFLFKVPQMFGDFLGFLKTPLFKYKLMLLLFGQFLEAFGLLFILITGHICHIGQKVLLNLCQVDLGAVRQLILWQRNSVCKKRIWIQFQLYKFLFKRLKTREVQSKWLFVIRSVCKMIKYLNQFVSGYCEMSFYFLWSALKPCNW